MVFHVTLPATAVAPLRQTLVRACGNLPWTIRQTAIRGSDRIRLTLQLPKSTVHTTLQAIARLAPGADISGLLEMPDAPSSGWLELTQAEPSARPAEPEHAEEALEEARIGDLLPPDHILLGLVAETPLALFEQIGQFFAERHGLDATEIRNDLAAREASGSTGIGQGFAVPHGHLKGLSHALAVYVRLPVPIPFDAPDGRPVGDAVVLLVPDWADALHLRLLAAVAERLSDRAFREQLMLCTTSDTVSAHFKQFVASGARPLEPACPQQ
ncbi:MAG: PTS sugar transporter subunit IIA [Burkholderiaceae bacterium]|nr:PTS sugar transporter subunit IIA [Burkholderiaceae bacterium]